MKSYYNLARATARVAEEFFQERTKDWGLPFRDRTMRLSTAYDKLLALAKQWDKEFKPRPVYGKPLIGDAEEFIRQVEAAVARLKEKEKS